MTLRNMLGLHYIIKGSAKEGDVLSCPCRADGHSALPPEEIQHPKP